MYVELNCYEIIEIYKNKHIVMNSDLGLLNISLYCLLSQEKREE